MEAITIKESQVLDFNLSMLVPLYPLSKEKFEILKKSSWDYCFIGSQLYAISLAFFIKIVSFLAHAIFLATISEDHTLIIDKISSTDCWIFGISLFSGIICSSIIPRFVTSKRDKVINECILYYKMKTQ